MEKYLVSACLCGVNCKYNGKNNLNEKCLDLLKKGRAVLVCPEQLGGLSTPRDPSEIIDGCVVTSAQIDVTRQFVNGAKETLYIAKNSNIKTAILKEGSPSCGVSTIYDGTFSGKKIDGSGITASLLKENGIKIISSEDIK